MTSSVKRLCTSSSSSSLIRYQWNPIVDDEYLRLPDLKSMIVGRVKDPRLTPEIRSYLNEIYPWTDNLKHVRRLHQKNEQVDIILYPTDFPHEIDPKKFDQYFEKETRVAQVPLDPCLLRWQYDTLVKSSWSNLIYKQNPNLERLLIKKEVTEFDEIIFDLFQVRLLSLFFLSIKTPSFFFWK